MIEGGWKFAGASVIGTSHQSKEDGVCQDFHACCYLEESSALVAVVSDGAGSASHSQYGSRCTCDYVIERAGQAVPGALLSHGFAVDVLNGLRGCLNDLAKEAGVALREFACTMLVAIIKEGRASFWQIGDGAICFRLDGIDRFQYAFWPEKGDYANVTFFVSDATAEQHLEFDETEGNLIDLAVFSDGLERLALDFVAGEAHTAFFNGLFPYLKQLEPGYSTSLSSQISTFLGSERVNKRTDDDKTLILASRAI